MAKPAKFNTTDKWMLAGSAICVAFMLLLACYVGREIKADQLKISGSTAPAPNRAPASVRD